MHVSIDIITERLHGAGMDAEVVRREERRGISRVTRDASSVTDATLLVVGADGIGMACGARHIAIVVPYDQEAPDSAAPNLALIRTDLPVHEVYSLVCEQLMELSQWDSRLLEAIATRQSVEVVLSIAAEQLDNPIALFDSRYALLCYAGELNDRTEGTIWDDVLAKRYSPLEYYSHDEQVRITKLMRHAWPFVLTPCRDPGHQNLSRGIFVNGEVVGTIGQVSVNEPFSPSQVALADLVADRLQLALVQRLGGNPGEDDTTYLIRGILNGNKTDKALVAYHLSRLRWSQDDRLTVLAFHAVEQGEAVSEEARLNRLRCELPDAILLAYENRIVALAREHWEESGQKVAKLLSKIGMVAVASEPFCGVLNVRLAYEQCLLAIEAVGEVRAGTIVRFADVYEHVMQHVLASAHDAQVLGDATILSLVTDGYRGDVERGKSLVRELYVYLMNGCNAHLTARQLYLHRNTLTYQIEQVERELGVKLDQLPSSRRLMLALSCLLAQGV